MRFKASAPAIAAVAAMVALATAPADAGTTTICLKPGVPLCMEDATTFVSAQRMQECQFAVKEYVERTMTYLQCLSDESAATGRELTTNVERFNCRLSGRRDCP
ncbi:hypothetical protein [Azospirillum halopraeferens]|uniref:hypothetical protein n=1 Tax=Azospirillum halopraeferens TaxID=34010 RepID=UPI0003FD0005|nr:hypothetical protein [Azospirillum halopraeferens]